MRARAPLFSDIATPRPITLRNAKSRAQGRSFPSHLVAARYNSRRCTPREDNLPAPSTAAPGEAAPPPVRKSRVSHSCPRCPCLPVFVLARDRHPLHPITALRPGMSASHADAGNRKSRHRASGEHHHSRAKQSAGAQRRRLASHGRLGVDSQTLSLQLEHWDKCSMSMLCPLSREEHACQLQVGHP